MDTKLKNYHKLTAVIVALVILLPSLAMMITAPLYSAAKQTGEPVFYRVRPAKPTGRKLLCALRGRTAE